jgi:hypothetical protein
LKNNNFLTRRKNNFFIQTSQNIHLYKYRNDMRLSVHGTANYTRSELATSLRKNPYQVIKKKKKKKKKNSK